MKMFKKIMAVVLTGALAVSMLTGCAISDAMGESAMKSELNRLGKANTTETTYEKGEKANDKDKDGYDLKAALTATKDAIKAKGDTATIDDIENIKTTKEGAVAFVYEVPSSSSKASNWTKIAKDLNDKLFASAYKKPNTKGDKVTITINYDTVSKKITNSNGKKVEKNFVVVVAKAAV